MNIKDIKNCYGCGVCATVCGKHIISIKLNPNGFYEPRIDRPEACTDCGLCMDVCSFNKDTLSLEVPEELHSYAVWSNDAKIRRKCSSGGVGFELGKTLLKQGYKVCGVRYNVEMARAEHYIATTPEELIPSIGSKYIQSYTPDGFKAIDRKQKYLVTGTPCQIDSFRRYIRKFKVEDNFVLMDFFCHSVPSMWVWKAYIQLVEKKVGKITYASWRNKQTGWHDSWAMVIDGDKNSLNSRLSKGDIFYKLFLGDYYCNPACRKDCKYKYRASSADIRIGDLWGKTYKHDEEGVSAAVAFTEKGNEILRLLDCILVEHPFETVAEGQMKRNCGQAYLSALAKRMLHRSAAVNENMWKVLFAAEKLLHLPGRIVNKINRVLR